MGDLGVEEGLHGLDFIEGVLEAGEFTKEGAIDDDGIFDVVDGAFGEAGKADAALGPREEGFGDGDILASGDADE